MNDIDIDPMPHVTTPLSQDRVALLSNDDSDLVALKWYAWRYVRGRVYYALRHERVVGAKRIKVSMHRVILARMLGRELLRREWVDHINGDGLDNRRCNLRLATPSQNGCNRGSMPNNKSGYKGVTLHNDLRWQAAIVLGGKFKYLGLYDNVIDAALAYDRAALRMHGEFAVTNYPPFASAATKG